MHILINISAGLASKNLCNQWTPTPRNWFSFSKSSWSWHLVSIFGNFNRCRNGKEITRSRQKYPKNEKIGCYCHRMVEWNVFWPKFIIEHFLFLRRERIIIHSFTNAPIFLKNFFSMFVTYCTIIMFKNIKLYHTFCLISYIFR